MGATQKERMQAARGLRADCRGKGYLDGLYGVEPRAEMHPPMERFAYRAGHEDGVRARETSMGAA